MFYYKAKNIINLTPAKIEGWLRVSLLHACHIPCPSHIPWFLSPRWWGTCSFWDFTQRKMAVSYRCLGGKTFRTHRRPPWPLKMVPISCPETLVTHYHSMPCNNPEERSSNTHHGGSLKSRTLVFGGENKFW